MLELKSLVVGLVFAAGMFAVKTGAGIDRFLSSPRPTGHKLVVLSGIAAGYLAVFLASWYVCSHADVVFYFNRLNRVFQSGMTLHVIVAAGLIARGFCLLRGNWTETGRPGLSWLFPAIPCPVCAAVIFSLAGILVSLFPDHSLSAVLGAYALCAAIVLATLLVLRVSTWIPTGHVEQRIGVGMLLVASYLVLSVLLVPHAGDVDKVYRVAAFHCPGSSVAADEFALLVVPAALAVGAGFLRQMLRQRGAR
ncbi:MAG: DUF2162 family putative transporter [Desulfomonilaceae bacterium]|nr:DUF2162 family putative transporter [Desulfomonilaceae bacterium]